MVKSRLTPVCPFLHHTTIGTNEKGQRSIYTTTTLKIPQSLTKHSNPHHGHGHGQSQGHTNGRPPDSDISDAGSGVLVQESYREIKCCFSVTIRRDAWGVPVAIMGQWIVSACLSRDRTNADNVAHMMYYGHLVKRMRLLARARLRVAVLSK
jgi:hypothetical protein